MLDLPSLLALPVSCQSCKKEGGKPNISTILISGILMPIPTATVHIKILMVPLSEQKVVRILSFDLASVWAWTFLSFSCQWMYAYNMPFLFINHASKCTALHIFHLNSHSAMFFMVMPYCWTSLINHCSS